MNEIKGYSAGAVGAIVAGGLALYTRQWGVAAAATSLTALAGYSRWVKRDEESPNIEAATQVLLVGSTLLALVPLCQLVVQGGEWANRAYLQGVVIPTLTLAANAFALANSPDREEDGSAEWVTIVSKTGCFLASALTFCLIARVAFVPTPFVALAFGGAMAWGYYRGTQEQHEADPFLLGAAAATAFITSSLLISRHIDGSLLHEMRGKLITLGEGALLTASMAALGIALKYYSSPVKEELL
ncbi:MAG: hypothetical protein AB7F31_01435 [Parachlamydiales bacterium]